MTRGARATLALFLTALLAGGGSVSSASAASAPGSVGLVSFVRASLTDTGATLTVAWSAAARATGYEVFASRSYSGVTAQTTPLATSATTTATLTRLTPGVDYFVQVRAVSPGHVGPRSNRVGHGTIAAEATPEAAAEGSTHRVLTWNVCSVKCSRFATRKKVIDARFPALGAGIVALQEASKYTKAPAGYAFAWNGQNDILYRTTVYSTVTYAGRPARGALGFSSKYATAGKGLAWAALRVRATGDYVVVFSVHLVTGTSKSAIAQRQYEASRVPELVAQVYRWLRAKYGPLTTWSAAPAIVAGDMNTNKSRAGDGTQSILERAGWYDSFDQARSLAFQHYNSANPRMSLTPVIGVTWGDHVDKVLVQPHRSVVQGWTSAGRQSHGMYTSPLGSDHNPVYVVVTLTAPPA